MSNRLLNLVWGVSRFGPERIGPLRRLVMVTLADRVSDADRDFCYPSIEDIAARTELGRSTTVRILKELRAEGDEWIFCEQRAGFGNVYRLNVARLEEMQRPGREWKRPSRLSRPATSSPATGSLVTEALGVPLNGLRGPASPLPILKNPIEPVVEPAPEFASLLSPKPVLVRPRSIADEEVESIRLAYPRKIAPVPARQAIRKHHGLLVAGKVTTAAGVKLSPMSSAEAAAYLLERTRAYASGPLPDDKQFIPYPASWFNEGNYTVDVGPGHNPSSSPRPASALDKMARRGL